MKERNSGSYPGRRYGCLLCFQTICTRLLVISGLLVLLSLIAISVYSSLVGWHVGQRQVIGQLESVATLREAEIERWLDAAEIMAGPTGLGITGGTYLVADNHALLTSLRSTTGQTAESPRFMRSLGGNPVLETGQNGGGLYLNYDQLPIIGGYHGLPRPQAALLVEQTQAEALVPFRSVLLSRVVLLLVVAFIAILVAIAFSAGSLAQSLRTRIGTLEQRVQELEGEQIVLKENEERYRTLYDNAPVMMHSIDGDGRLISVNDQWLQTMGYEWNEVIGQPSLNFLTPDSRQYARDEVLPQFRATGHVQDVSHQLVTKDGTIIDVLLASTVHYDEQKQYQWSVAVVQDARERKRFEEQLRQSEERQRALLSAMPDIMFRITIEGVFLDYKAEQSQLVMQEAEIIGTNMAEMPLPPELVQETLRLVRQTVTTGQMATFEYELQIPLGLQSFECRMIKSGSNEAVCIVRDITERKHAETILRRSEELLNATNHVTRTGGWELDLRTNELYWTQTIKEIHELAPDYVPSLEEGIQFYAPEYVPVIQNCVAEAIKGHAYDMELQIITAKQKRLWVRAIGRPVFENGQVVKLHGIFQDIHSQKLFGEALRQSEERLRVIVENAPIGIVVTSLDGQLQQVNAAMCQTLGYTATELLSMSIADITYPDDLPTTEKLVRALVASEIPACEIEKRYLRKDGSLITAILQCATIRDGQGNVVALIGQMLDISERKESEAKIVNSLREKEVLLKEIHHRVKNNLQVISSLLDLQASYVSDAQVHNMLQDSRGRVRSMALVHEQLYQAVDLAQIDFADYVDRLTSYLFRSYGQQAGRVDLQLEVAPLLLSVETAVPLGLIINELVSNAFKHAFPNQQSGHIVLQLHRQDENQLCLRIQDNGIGLPPNIDMRRSPSLGFTIVHTLIEQLGGHFEQPPQAAGTCFEIKIPQAQAAESP